MDLKKAIEIVRDRWGSSATCSVDTTYLVSSKDKVEEINWFTIGLFKNGEIHIMGQGVSWEEALKSATEYERYINGLTRRRTTNQR